MTDLEPVVTEPEPLFSGKSIFSALLPEDLNMQQRSNFCKKCDECLDEDCPHDAYLNIVNGNIVSGVLDEKSYGAGKHTSILLRLTKDYGPKAAREFLDDSSNMLLYVIVSKALTMGLDEVDITHIMPKIDDVILKANQRCNEFITAYNMNDEETLPCAPGRTYQETLELRILEVLNIARDNAGKIASTELGDTAHSVIMTKSGARGNPLNLTMMAACVGQQSVRGDRIHRGFYNRTLPHFKRNDLTPQARGFVESSYREGLDPIEFFMHAMGGREGLVDTAVRTSSSGYMQRRLVNALQDMVVQNDGTVRTSTDNIIQFVYGDDMIDPGKSDHGEAVNVKNIFLKAKNLEGYLEKSQDLREREQKRLKSEGMLTKELKDQFDYINNYKVEFDADKTQSKPKAKKTKKSTKAKKVTKKTSKTKSKKSTKKSVKIGEVELKKLYNEETGKNAIYRGKMTKIYKTWREKKLDELGEK
jgi:DNA-directed RNA polymerase subunit A'